MPGPGVPGAMKLGLAAAALLLCACRVPVYDPLDELSFRVFPDARAAVGAILGEVRAPRVYAVGEYHPTRATAGARSPLAHFTDEIIGLLEPRAQHLVVESWFDGCRGDGGERVAAQVAAAIHRPASTGAELQRLAAAAVQRRLVTHTLPMTCIEQSAMLDPRGKVDFLRLLETITYKLEETARRLVDEGRDVIIYGGALHNDLYPRHPFEELSYARGLARELGDGVLELDLVVPEVVAPLASVRTEAWFPLLGLASPDRVVVWERGPESYVVMLPAQREGASVAQRPAPARR